MLRVPWDPLYVQAAVFLRCIKGFGLILAFGRIKSERRKVRYQSSSYHGRVQCGRDRRVPSRSFLPSFIATAARPETTRNWANVGRPFPARFVSRATDRHSWEIDDFKFSFLERSDLVRLVKPLSHKSVRFLAAAAYFVRGRFVNVHRRYGEICQTRENSGR